MFPSKTLLYLKEGWQAEYISDLGTPYAMHVRGGRKRAGEFVPRVKRILDDEHIMWVIERDLATPGDYKGKGLRPKKDENGRVVRTPEEWIQPYHESIKRLKPKRTNGWAAFRYHWLVAWLRWRHLPCLCGHKDIVHHLAVNSGQPIGIVQAGIERAGSQAVRLIGDKVPGNPSLLRNGKGLSVRVYKAENSAKRQVAPLVRSRALRKGVGGRRPQKSAPARAV